MKTVAGLARTVNRAFARPAQWSGSCRYIMTGSHRSPSDDSNSNLAYFGRLMIVVGGIWTVVELDQYINDRYYDGKSIAQRLGWYQRGPSNDEWVDERVKHYKLVQAAKEERRKLAALRLPPVEPISNKEALIDYGRHNVPVGSEYDLSQYHPNEKTTNA